MRGPDGQNAAIIGTYRVEAMCQDLVPELGAINCAMVKPIIE